MTGEVRFRSTCRACQGPLTEVLHLGVHRLNAFPATVADALAAPQAPLILTVCTRCSLAQLAHTVPPDWMYRTYWYKSGVNESMVAELQGIVKEATLQVPLAASDYVLDIGANDGTLLQTYQLGTVGGYMPIRVAVEPAKNLHTELNRHTDILIRDYFPTQELDRLKGRFKIITAIACCYDLEDPTAFFQKIAELLHPDGVVVVQFQDLLQQLQATAFDNIVHEHLEYYTLGSLQQILGRVGLSAVRVHRRPINGGSLRVTLRPTSTLLGLSLPSVLMQLQDEMEACIGPSQVSGGDLSAFDTFRAHVGRVTDQIRATVHACHTAGEPVDWYGASTKSNCTLQVLEWGPEVIRQAIDRNPEKHGRCTITGIPIVGEEDWQRDPTRLTVMGIWQFRDFALKRERWYLKQGGSFLVPLPRVEIVQEGSHAVATTRQA